MRKIPLIFCFFLLFSKVTFAGVILKVSASNPSEYSDRTVPVKMYLPRGISPENVIDIGPLELNYDVRRGQYYVYKEEILKPKGVISFDVEIEDIWVIDENRLRKLKAHSEELFKKLEKSRYKEAAEKLKKEIDKDISDIFTTQDEGDVDRVTPIEHIGVFERNQIRFEKVRENIGIMETLISSTTGDPGEVMGTSGLGVKNLGSGGESQKGAENVKSFKQLETDSCLVQEELRDTEGTGVFGEKNRVSILINVENPSKDEETTVPLTYFLPDEVRADDMIDSAGLELGYNFGMEKYYVFKEEITLDPGEERVYDVVVKDKWLVDKAEILALKIHVEKMLSALKGVKEFRSAKELGEDALKKIYQLLERKSVDILDKEHVAQFRRDQGILDAVQKDLFRMEDILTQSGVVPEVTIVDEEILCEEMRAAKEKKTTVKKTQMQTKGIKMLAQTIFQGKAPDLEGLWKIIFYIIAFLGIMSFVFFSLWSAQVKQEEGKKYDKVNPEIKAEQGHPEDKEDQKE